ncbi:MAG TPA: 4-alpha-glucanotransferase [Pseudomonadota bacterium]|nr:4-alpha-glucanotransferase [Pseudomonadota bacterium]
MDGRSLLPGRSSWPRHSGFLLHITSLPGRGGVGDLGSAAFRFLDDLCRAGQRAWQVLPVGPTGFGDSPYQTSSVMGGHPLFVSVERLVEQGLLSSTVLSAAPADTGQADYEAARAYKEPLFAIAHRALLDGKSEHMCGLRADFRSFVQAEQEWLADFALFSAIKQEQGQRPWTLWPPSLRDRDSAAIADARNRLSNDIDLHCFVQWQFERQWQAVRSAAHERGIELIGDVPIFVAHDSVEVWCNRAEFLLFPDGSLKVQAGVPPDYFSKTGQLWGNPLYDWEAMQRSGFAFWRRRIRRAAQLFDRVRIDHFRGFSAHWEVPAQDQTAERGRWVTAPGHALFQTLTESPETRSVRFIAEDLGVITPDVEELRDRFVFPGIRVLQFGFGDDDFYDGRPWAFRKNAVVYTSTHDNATLLGWYFGEPEGTRTQEQAALERDKLHDYLGYTPRPEAAHFALIRLALSTPAETVIIPVQDVLGLPNSARMNTPGKPSGNWRFRLVDGQLDDGSLQHMRYLTRLFARTVR